EIFYGPSNAPHIQGLYDVIWSQGDFSLENGGIPYQEMTTYQQLNTTWAIGPDGKFWATGIGRGDFASAFLPLQPYSGSRGFGLPGNLDIDELLNSVDPG